MFAYFSAVTPNQQLELGPLFTISLLTLIIVLINADLLQASNVFNTFIPQPFHPPTTTILAPINTPIYLSLGAILFLALIAVVKVSRLSAGPLRPFI